MPQAITTFGLMAAAIAVAGCTAGCTTTSGTAVAPSGGYAAAGRSSPAMPASGSVPGVETTLPEKIPPNALLCYVSPDSGGAAVTAKIRDPAAPRIVLLIPGGWSSNAGLDPALSLLGPQGMSGSVRITATADDPAAAFGDYLADLQNTSPGTQFDVEGAEFCGYSSQRITGRSGGQQIADRITHIWTNTGKYLVAIHLQGPDSATDFESAKSVLLRNFSVTIP